MFEEAFQRGLDEERREKEKMERKKREEERARKEKIARQEERARKLARAREAQEEDEARDKKGKWPRVTQYGLTFEKLVMNYAFDSRNM